MKYFNYLTLGKDEEAKKQFKRGIIHSTQQNFKYYKLLDSDINKLDLLQGITMDENKFIIMTTFNYNFNTDDYVILDGIEYKIVYIQEKEIEDVNNSFNFKTFKKRYLHLQKQV